MNNRSTLAIAGFSGAMCVALGAMGAHALKSILPTENLQVFETAVKYQFYHTFALLAVFVLATLKDCKFLRYAKNLFIAGMILFSFSLYFLALRPIIGISNDEMKWVGAITPLGGLSFILGWLFIAIYAIRKQ